MNEGRCDEKLKSRVVYYESIKRELKTRPTYDCRCDERLKTKTEDSAHLTYTGSGCAGRKNSNPTIGSHGHDHP